MIRLLLLLLIPLAAYCQEGEDNILVNLGSIPSGVVNSSVNVISGDYVEVAHDLVLPGVDNLTFSRNFSPFTNRDKTDTLPGWANNHRGRVVGRGVEKPSKKVDESVEAEYLGPYGMVLIMDGDASSSTREQSVFKVPSATFRNGMTNTASGGVSGKTSYRNLSMRLNTKIKVLYVRDGGGEKRRFRYKKEKTLDRIIYPENYLLEHVEHPNRHHTFYTYNEKRQLSKIVTKNGGFAPLSIIEIDYINSHTVEVKASNEQKVKYLLAKSKPHLIERVESSSAPPITYDYYPEKGNVNDYKVRKKSYPRKRFLETVYYEKGTTVVGDKAVKIKHSDDYSLGKVAFQRAPVGATGKPVITHKYFYREFPNFQGETWVYDALDHLTTYHHAFNKLHKIVHHNGRGKHAEPYLLEKFLWPNTDSKDTGNILGHVICSDDITHLISKNFLYDSKGNVIQELLYGDLSGYNKAPILLEGCWVANNGVECFEKLYTYSDDCYNNMLSEEDFRKKTTYAYYPGSNLLKHEFVHDNGRIAIRTFYFYDGNSALGKVVVDDGSAEEYNDLSDVTERRITEYHNLARPLPGLPCAVTEKYLDLETMEERTLTNKTMAYTKEGWVKELCEYDSSGNLLAREEKEYDSKGNVVKVVDPFGYVTTHQYDANNNMTASYGPHPERAVKMEYDNSNRLVKKRECYKDGGDLAESYSYDYLGNKLTECDCYGNVISYEYDDLCRKTAEIRGDGSCAFRNRYNKLNHLVEKVDGNGMVRCASYNVRAQPVHIYFPDGTSEHCRYTLDGLLEEEISKEGIRTSYERDFLGRVTRATRTTKEGAYIDETLYSYNAFHLLKEVDPQGKEKSYRYDGAGRLVEENDGGRIKKYQYDDRGRKVKSIDYASALCQVITCSTYDALDRVVKEVVTDGEGNVQLESEMEYDCDGNEVAVTVWGEKGAATHCKEYNARGDIVKEVDAEGDVTRYNYRYDYYDEEGFTVGYTEKVDPLGNKSITIKDRCGRDKVHIREDGYGKIQHKSCFTYDGNDNKVESVEHVYLDGEEVRSVVNRWEYDASNRLVKKIEAAGTALQKVTEVAFNSLGQKSRLVKADGVVIGYEYDEKGNLERLYSSDGSVDYTYSYDAMGQLIAVEDLVSNKTTERLYSPHGELLQEKLANGHTIATSYDDLGRIERIVHPDGLAIEHRYSGNNLKSIAAIESEGQEKWRHIYEEVDLRGKVVQAKLPGNAGIARYDYDLLGRVVNITTDHWREKIAGFDEAGNLIGRIIEDAFGRREDSYRYDSLQQLTSERGGVVRDYRTDSLNNRVAKDGVENVVNGLNQLRYDGVRSYHYDLNGNIVKISGPDGEVTLAYDALDRLIELERGGVITRYSYDHDHRRLSKNEETYLYHGKNEVGRVGACGAIEERRILGKGIEAEIGAAVALEIGAILYVPIHDHNGNVVALVDGESGQRKECYRHSAFGEELAGCDESINPWRFSSKRVDEESGFVYFGRRYYIPEVGRWISQDPLGDRDGPNLYAYVANNPLTSVDAYGLYSNSRYFGNGRWDYANEENGTTTATPLCRHSSPSMPLNFRAPLADNEGDQILDYAYNNFRTLGLVRVGNKPPPPGVAVSFICGVNNTPLSCISTAQNISDAHDGAYVYALFHRDTGVFHDAAYCLHEKCGISMPTTKELGRFFEHTVNILKNQSPDPMLYHHCHSRGGMETDSAARPLSKTTRQQMHVASYGSANIMPKKLFGYIMNYVNNNDLVSMSDPYGYRNCRDVIKFTGYIGGSIFNIPANHSMDTPGYRDSINLEARDCLENERWQR